MTQSEALSDLQIDCRRMVTLIGSRTGCKVNLRHRSIAPVQVALVNTGEEVIAVDLLTKNPTKLNGLKMEHEPLNDGDKMTIGPWEFDIEIASPDHHSNGDDLHHVQLEPSPNGVALEHLETGRILQSARDICIIGRRSGCDIHLDDTNVSRVHALLVSVHDHPVICDLMSSNQTFVNDEAVVYKVLKNNDLLRIGDTQFRIHLMDSSINPSDPNVVKLEKAAESKKSVNPIDDLIDIEEVESASPWKIADKLKRA